MLSMVKALQGWIKAFLQEAPPETTLEDLLRSLVKVPSVVRPGEMVDMSPDFRVSVQHIRSSGVHFIIHADGHRSDTLDFLAIGDDVFRI